jgi:hypothetical protein
LVFEICGGCFRLAILGATKGSRRGGGAAVVIVVARTQHISAHTWRERKEALKHAPFSSRTYVYFNKHASRGAAAAAALRQLLRMRLLPTPRARLALLLITREDSLSVVLQLFWCKTLVAHTHSAFFVRVDALPPPAAAARPPCPPAHAAVAQLERQKQASHTL